MDQTILIGFSLASVVFLSLIHVLADVLRWKRQVPKKYWLSFADGISISYVFLGLLPKIVDGTSAFPDTLGHVADILRNSPFLPLLICLVAFYGMERLVEKPSNTSGAGIGYETAGLRVWIHLASYAFYTAIIGYLIVQMNNPVSVVIFAISMAVHFLVVDDRMMEIHKGVYQSIGRWLLTVAILVGWIVGATTVISPALVTLLLSFLAGGIVLVVLEEEFSRDHPSSFPAFVTAAALTFGAGLALSTALLHGAGVALAVAAGRALSGSKVVQGLGWATALGGNWVVSGWLSLDELAPRAGPRPIRRSQAFRLPDPDERLFGKLLSPQCASWSALI